jgi:hypothetical protein
VISLIQIDLQNISSVTQVIPGTKKSLNPGIRAKFDVDIKDIDSIMYLAGIGEKVNTHPIFQIHDPDYILSLIGGPEEERKGSGVSDDALVDLAGEGRTTETVMGNAAAIADMTQQLANMIGSGVIARASNVVTATGGESSIEIGISGFDSNVYHLDAYCNGVLLALTSEYTIDDEDGEIDLVDWTATAADIFIFVAYKKDPVTKITVSLTVEGWSGNSQTVTASGVTATNLAIVAPAPADQSDYVAAGIICTAQGANSLTFFCSETPTSAIDVGVVII